jgi:hypothetical protein
MPQAARQFLSTRRTGVSGPPINGDLCGCVSHDLWHPFHIYQYATTGSSSEEGAVKQENNHPSSGGEQGSEAPFYNHDVARRRGYVHYGVRFQQIH